MVRLMTECRFPGYAVAHITAEGEGHEEGDVMDVHREGADAAQGDDSPDREGHAAAGDGSLVPEGWNRFLGSWNDEGIGAGLPIPGVSDSMVSHGQAMHPGEGLDDGHREGEDRAEES